MTTVANFEMHRGDNAAFELTITEDAAPVDLTGATLRFWAKLDIADAAAVIEKASTTASEIEVTDAPNGLATVYFVPADTDDFTEVTVLFYDVQVTDALGKVYTLAKGKIKVLLDVTRA